MHIVEAKESVEKNTKRYLEKNKRPLTKTVSWRATATTLSFGIAYMFTGAVTTSLGITAMIAVVNTIGYYLHERQWSKSEWGRGEDN